MRLIDVHTHAVPPGLAGRPAPHRLWPLLEMGQDGKGALVIDGTAFRQLDSRSWDAEARLRDMAGDDTGVQVLSPMPELLSHWLPADVADELCTVVNEGIAGMVARDPSRFMGVGMVPVQDAGLAARHLERLAASGFRGVEVGTHIDGVPLGDPRLDPVYAQLERLGLVLFVHPLHPAGLDRVGSPRELASVAAFPTETALAAVSLLGGQVLDRFPRLRILLSHGGGALPWIAPRIEFARTVLPVLGSVLPRPVGELMRRFWYDTIVHDAQSLRWLAERVGADRLAVGSDYPFNMRQPRPGAFAGAALPEVDFDAAASALFGVVASP